MFRIESLDPTPFAPLFALDEAELADRLARRVVASADMGFPCRASLRDAPRGETLILANYQHQSAATPYQATHAVYIRENAEKAELRPGEVPAMFETRTLSLRGFDARGLMRDAAVVEGRDLAGALDALFGNQSIAEIHIHFAAPGCFAARAVRAG
ncbi:DUF1203 domain-containing protein [Hyphobacterium sp. HN65]|uniref:DUF1203 domain-containing protein n=1 Tax=Hyphobacterium lacteum TaxID=3116575 RepID=A0ABU7LLJ0_9PROT|nr:DUF1203 domain-containing protein [Hyphobacterium sp. HN65]MEE2524798.1 DUF1203 domain-containing protein [Hyphobacterium sp. HN65]